jgi:PadR family transcriptional regulator, regulatory protein PadR
VDRADDGSPAHSVVNAMSEWGLSENNRRAKYYTLTASGRRELRAEATSWRRYVGLMARVLDAAQQPS